MTTKYPVLAIVFGITLLLSLNLANAAPMGGAASGITSNAFNVSISGSDGGDTWIAWGTVTGAHPWASGYYTGDGAIMVYGAPIIGGSTIYYVACDSTGCDTNERSLNIPAITPIPTLNFGQGWRNLTNKHFAINSIMPNILPGYWQNGMDPTLLWGIMCVFIVFGFWFRTRSVKLVLVLAFLMATFILVPSAGLMLGQPLMFQYVAQGLLAAAMAGVLVSFIRK